MSIFDRFKESAGAGATILGFVGIIGSVAVYGTNLKNQFDASQTKIVQLETQVATLRDQLDKSYNSTAETIRGPKGDKGDRGERGERGEQGPQGERGPSGEAASPVPNLDLQDIVRRLEILEKESIQTRGVNASVSTSAAVGSGCIELPVTQTSGAFLVSNGARICGTNGEFLGQVEIGKSVKFRDGGKYSTCGTGSPCKFLETQVAKFVLDSVQSTADGTKQGLFSVYPK